MRRLQTTSVSRAGTVGPEAATCVLTPNEPAAPAEPSAGAAEPLVFERLYDVHFGFSWRVLDHLGVSRHALEDAAQEVWLVVHRRLGTFTGRSQFRTWLFGIALNVARNHRRAEARRKPFQPVASDVASPHADPEALCARAEAYQLVQRFLGTLDEQQRAIFVCNLLEHLSAAETAEATAVEVMTVYQTVRTLRRRFKKFLEEREESSA